MTGVHPGDDDLAALATAFEQASEASDDPAEKTRLQNVSDTLKQISGEVAKRVVAAYIAARIPS